MDVYVSIETHFEKFSKSKVFFERYFKYFSYYKPLLKRNYFIFVKLPQHDKLFSSKCTYFFK